VDEQVSDDMSKQKCSQLEGPNIRQTWRPPGVCVGRVEALPRGCPPDTRSLLASGRSAAVEPTGDPGLLAMAGRWARQPYRLSES